MGLQDCQWGRISNGMYLACLKVRYLCTLKITSSYHCATSMHMLIRSKCLVSHVAKNITKHYMQK